MQQLHAAESEKTTSSNVLPMMEKSYRDASPHGRCRDAVRRHGSENPLEPRSLWLGEVHAGSLSMNERLCLFLQDSAASRMREVSLLALLGAASATLSLAIELAFEAHACLAAA